MRKTIVAVIAGVILVVGSFAAIVALMPGSTEEAGGPVDTRFAINLVEARDAGCSGDILTAADPEVRVFLDGKPILYAEADDDSTAPFASFAFVTPLQPSVVRVEAWEEEVFGSETCALGLHGEPFAEFTWDGSDLVKVIEGGEMHITLVLGHPPTPASAAAVIADGQVRFTWEAPVRHPAAAFARMPGSETAMHQVAPTSGNTTFSYGACDNSVFHPELILHDGAWRVPTRASVLTPNATPRPVQVYGARTSFGGLSVDWEPATSHDITVYRVYVGPPGFQPGASTLWQEVHGTDGYAPWPHARHETPRTTGEVIVEAVDTIGASALSDPFAIGRSEQSNPTPDACPHPTGAADTSTANYYTAALPSNAFTLVASLPSLSAWFARAEPRSRISWTRRFK